MKFTSDLQILVPVDFSTQSHRAIDYALQLTGRTSNVHALHIRPSLSLYEPAAVLVQREAEVRARYRALFEKRFPTATYPELQFDLRFGDPGRQIATYANTHHIGLIVMPTHGRKGFNRILRGSVAERTLRLAACPTLVLPWITVQRASARLSA